jgi:hypothetical protein
MRTFSVSTRMDLGWVPAVTFRNLVRVVVGTDIRETDWQLSVKDCAMASGGMER